MKKEWKVIADHLIKHYWQCVEPGCDTGAYVGPGEYQDIGTPMCVKCDCDMVYFWTEVKVG